MSHKYFSFNNDLSTNKISRLALGLKNAGMTPEEVGRALAAAVAVNTNTVKDRVSETEPDDDDEMSYKTLQKWATTDQRMLEANLKISTEYFQTLSKEEKIILMADCGITDERSLIEYYSKDDDWFEFNDKDIDYDGWCLNKNDNLTDEDRYAAYHGNIQERIAETKTELAKTYPGIYPVIAAAIKLNLVTDNDHIKHDLINASVAAAKAGRDKPVPIKIVVSKGGHEKPFVESAFYDQATKNRLNDYSENRIRYYKAGKQFVIVLSGDADDLVSSHLSVRV